MPNHFHFIVAPKDSACSNIILNDKETNLQTLSKAIGKTLSSYTLAINRQENRTGNLFQKKTKAKNVCVVDSINIQHPYLLGCVQYVHFNPVFARMVTNPIDWEFSSARDYAGIRNGTLCNKDLLLHLSGMKKEDFDYSNFDTDEILSKMY